MHNIAIYKRHFPLVEIPQYSDSDIMAERDKLLSMRNKDVKEWFKKYYYLKLSIALMTQFLLVLFFYYFNSDDFAVLKEVPFNIIISVTMPMFFLSAMLAAFSCPIGGWYKKPSLREAEKELRIALCSEQLLKANEKEAIQIYIFCTTFLETDSQ